jgi:mannose-6-phosphate isomerase-like protein (cupin superfamily)
MEVVNVGKVRHFLREKPIRVNLFDRPRMFCEVICLEPDQQETRHSHDLSDAFYLVVEGRAHLRAGTQAQDLEEQDLVMVPPGVEHYVQNPGPGRLTVLAMLAPKPARAAEVRMPRLRWAPSAETFTGQRPAGQEAGRERGPEPSRRAPAAPRRFGQPRAPYPRASTEAGPSRRFGGGPAKEEPARARPPRREAEAERPPAPRRRPAAGGGGYPSAAGRGEEPVEGRRPSGRGRPSGPRAGAVEGRRPPGAGRGAGSRGGFGKETPGRRGTTGGPRSSQTGRPGRPGSDRSGPRTSTRRRAP